MLLTAREAADRLGVKLDTLYAYVSRGRLRSLAVPGSRQRRYRQEDVDALRDPAIATVRGNAEELTPVIASSICLIERGRLYYRGQDAIILAQTASLEEVAALLWQDPDGTLPIPGTPTPVSSTGRAVAGAHGLNLWAEGPRPGAPPNSPDHPRVFTQRAIASVARGRGGEGGVGVPAREESAGEGREGWGLEGEAGLGLIERCQLRLAQLSAIDLAALDLTRAGVMRTGRLILDALGTTIGGTVPEDCPLHRRIAASWHLDVEGVDLVRRCLVLLADHELNASTFVARCVASTGATPYAVVSAALAALSGRRHGGASAQAEVLLHELMRGGDPMAGMAARLARNETLPGFGQPLYPEGDPRAVAILDALAGNLPEAWRRIEPILAAAAQLIRQRANVDFALAAATAALGLPQGAALALFIVGRSVGWIAHAIEQYETGILIRPRARYTGPRPGES
jgi:citrate synthase